MEKIIYILILIILENNFYKDIKSVDIINYDFIVNKKYKLDKNYIPSDLEKINLEYACEEKYLRNIAKINFENMAKTAKKDGFNLIAVSTYRSYEYQEKLYNNYVKEKGLYYADMASARAGHSEHQTGLAVDIADLSLDYDNFEKTKEFNWVKDNAHKFGFIMRYPKAKFHVTGFKYEPWHYRYVGVEVATYIYNNNLTLEEYYFNKKITHRM